MDQSREIKVELQESKKKEPCKHQWVKVASSMAESKYVCTICGEEDWH